MPESDSRVTIQHVASRAGVSFSYAALAITTLEQPVTETAENVAQFVLREIHRDTEESVSPKPRMDVEVVTDRRRFAMLFFRR